MPAALPDTLPVFSRLHSLGRDLQHPITAAENAVNVDGWLDEPKSCRRSKICDAFRETAGRDWVSLIVSEWKLDRFSLAELSDRLGISWAQTSRFRNHFSTSIGVLGQCAAFLGRPLPAPDFHRWSIKGIAGSLPVTAWLRQVGLTRRNRTPLPAKLPEHLIYLLSTLLSSGLVNQWDLLTYQYRLDLYRAADDQKFLEFIGRFGDAYLRLTQQMPKGQYRHVVYFPNGRVTPESRWFLCLDLDSMWRAAHADAERLWEAVNGLTPWLANVIDDEHDDEAA